MKWPSAIEVYSQLSRVSTYFYGQNSKINRCSVDFSTQHEFLIGRYVPLFLISQKKTLLISNLKLELDIALFARIYGVI